MPVKRYQYDAAANLWRAMDGSDTIQPPQPPVTPYPYFGCSIPDGFVTTTNRNGGLAVARTYYQGDVGDWTSGDVGTVVANSTNCAIVHSFHSWNEANVLAWMQNKPQDGRVVFLCYDHEPDNNGWTQAQIDDWKSKQQRMRELWITAGRRSDIKLTRILTQYSLITSKALATEPDYWVAKTAAGDNVWDVLGFDFYDAGYKNGQYQTNANFTKIISCAAQRGLPWAIGETSSGIGPSRPMNATARQTWMKNFAQTCIDNGAIYVCWWDAKSNAVWQSGTTEYNTYGPVNKVDYRVNPSPEMVGKSPGTQAGQVIYGEHADNTEQQIWAGFCATSRSKNGVAYP